MFIHEIVIIRLRPSDITKHKLKAVVSVSPELQLPFNPQINLVESVNNQ